MSLFLVLRDRESTTTLQLWLGAISVVLGWFAVHTMWAMHYAFEYYQAPDEEQGRPKSGKVQAGLEFPGGEDPNGVAFFYFAYVVGMTAQTSDTAITTNAMRRLVRRPRRFFVFLQHRDRRGGGQYRRGVRALAASRAARVRKIP